MDKIIQQTQHRHNIHMSIRYMKRCLHFYQLSINLVSLLPIFNFSASQSRSQQLHFLESPSPYESGLEFSNKRHLYYSLKIGRKSKAWGPEECDEINGAPWWTHPGIFPIYTPKNMYKNLHNTIISKQWKWPKSPFTLYIFIYS